VISVRQAQHLDQPAAFDGLAENPHFGSRHQIGDIHQFQAEPGVRSIGPEPVHGLRVTHAREGRLQGNPEQVLEEARDPAFNQVVDLFFANEGHFQIHLGKFRLTVSPQIFIPKTLDDLEVSFHSRHHEQLFEDLGRLGQRIKPAWIDTAGNQVIPGPFRRALGEHRGLHLHKALLVEVAAGELGRPVPQDEIFEHVLPPKIEIAIPQSDVFADIQFLFQLKRWSFGRVEDFELVHDHFNFPRCQLGIGHTVRAGPHSAPNGNDEFAAQGMSTLVGLRLILGIKHHLGEPLAIPQIDKDQAAVVAAAQHPAHEGDGCPEVAVPQAVIRVALAPVSQ